VAGHPYSRRAKTALILSPDSLGAALLGAATELSGFRVAYLADPEGPADGIRRVKPIVVLVDATDAIASDPAALGPALMTGAAVVFYGTASRLRDIRLVVAAAHAETITLPDELDRLPGILTAVAGRTAGRRLSE
jgi:hypothetical protein